MSARTQGSARALPASLRRNWSRTRSRAGQAAGYLPHLRQGFLFFGAVSLHWVEGELDGFWLPPFPRLSSIPQQPLPQGSLLSSSFPPPSMAGVMVTSPWGVAMDDCKQGACAMEAVAGSREQGCPPTCTPPGEDSDPHSPSLCTGPVWSPLNYPGPL